MENISCSDEIDLKSLIESKEGLHVAIERCPLCSESKRPFHCRKCVESGQFIHSNATYPDSYESLHRKWDRTKIERNLMLERFKNETAKLQERYDKRAMIEKCKGNIELLKLSLAATKRMVIEKRAVVDKLSKENQIRESKDRRHREKKRRILEYVRKVTATIKTKKEELEECQTVLMELRKKHIDDLTYYIFPITEVPNRGETLTMGASDDLREALQEASQMAYVQGRWIYSGSQYRIVEPILPSYGEYSQYNIMVARISEDGNTDICKAGNLGYSIVAALCYTSQLVSVLSYILNVCLPTRQCYSDFCLQNLMEKQFNSAVSKLNKNILYLCFSQGVDSKMIEPKHTLLNVLLLLKHDQLGRIGTFDVIQDIMDSIEDSNGQSEESDDDSTCIVKPKEPEGAEWEQVPDTISIQAEAASNQNLGYVSQDMSDSTLSASGVFSSAYNTVSSFFTFRR